MRQLCSPLCHLHACSAHIPPDHAEMQPVLLPVEDHAIQCCQHTNISWYKASLLHDHTRQCLVDASLCGTAGLAAFHRSHACLPRRPRDCDINTWLLCLARAVMVQGGFMSIWERLAKRLPNVNKNIDIIKVDRHVEDPSRPISIM